MKHASLALAFPIAASIVSCGSVEIVPGQTSGSTTGTTGVTSATATTGAGGAGGSTTTGTGGAGGVGGGGGGGGAAGGEPLSGHYMLQQIGNCIDEEEWLSFGPGEDFTHTMVDRNYCGPHFVLPSAGTQKVSGPILDLTWPTEQGEESRHFTFLLVDPYVPEILDPPPGYEYGTEALLTKTYARAGDSLVYHREDRSVSKDKMGWAFERGYVIDVTFDAPLGMPSGPTACSMMVDLVVTVQIDPQKPKEVAKETFPLPCTYDVDATSPFVRVVVDGFENPWGKSWYDYLMSLGVLQKYSGFLQSEVSNAFQPVLYFVPGNEGRLFHITWASAYGSMKHGPPESVP